MIIATKILRIVYALLLLYIAFFFNPTEGLPQKNKGSSITYSPVRTVLALN